MRSVRPPPKVTPPKPPAHLFEPREDIAPLRMELPKEKAPPVRVEAPKENAPSSYEDDVKFQMQQLEAEMQALLAEERAMKSAAVSEGLGGSLGSKQQPFGQQPPPSTAVVGKGDPFAPRISPSDWKAKGFPSEFAYMKAMGQLDISNDPPGKSYFADQNKVSLQSKIMSEPPIGRDNYPRANGPSLDSAAVKADQTMDRRYEREMVSPARRKGGAIQNLYNDEENLRRKFASQHEYNDILQRQAEEQRQIREAEKLAHRGLAANAQRGSGAVPMAMEQIDGMRFPSEQRKPAAVPQPQQGPPRDAPPPGRATGPESQYPYPERRMDQRGYPDEAGPVRRAMQGAMPGAEDPRGPAMNARAVPSKMSSPPRKPREDPASTSLPLGMDKQSELALKRARQEEYKRQLDAMKPPQEVVPAAQTAVVDSTSYLHTGVRPAPAAPRVAPAPAAPAVSSTYDRSGDAARGRAGPAAPGPVGMPQDPYASQAYRAGTAEVPLYDPSERYAALNHLERLRDTHAAPVQVRDQADHLRYLEMLQAAQAEPSQPPPRYAPGYPSATDPRLEAYNSNRRYESPAPGRSEYPRGPISEEDMYRAMMAAQRQPPPDFDQRGHLRHAPAQEPPAAVNAAAVAARNEKDMKRQEQEEYRRMLERQMEEKKAQKERAKKEEEDRDQKFLKSLAETETENNIPRRRKAAGGQQPAPAPAVKTEAAPQPQSRYVDSDVPPKQPRAGSFDEYGSGVGANRGGDPSGGYDSDAAAEYAYYQARAMAAAAEGARERVDPQDRYEDRRMREEPVPARDLAREFQDRGGARGGRGLHVDPYAPNAQPSDESPHKSPNQARSRFMQDIYGSDLISHDTQRPLDKGVVGGAGWKPSLGSVDDRKRQQMLEQKAALDAQKAENDARKAREKAEQDAKDKAKEERERLAQEKEEAEKLAEKRKKDALQEQTAREIAALQEKREMEAMARKNRGRRPAASENDAADRSPAPAPAPKVTLSRQPAAETSRNGYGDGEPSAKVDYDHIRSPLREALREQQVVDRDRLAQAASQDYGRASGGISIYQPTSVDAVDSFVRSYQNEHRQAPPPQQPWGPPAGYAPPPQFAPSPYASYSQGPAGGYAGDYYGYPPPQQQRPPFGLYPQPGNFYPPNMLPDQSLHAESRLLPVNPWSSSDILSSLAPIGAKATAAAQAHAEEQLRRVGRTQAQNDMEKSMASESTLVYLGSRTPAGTERPRTRPNAVNAPAAAAHSTTSSDYGRPPSEPIQRSARPIASPAGTQLSELIAETNRLIEQERAAQEQAHVQKKEVVGGSSKRNPHPILPESNSPVNRISGKKASFEDYAVGDHDGISTVARQDSRAQFGAAAAAPPGVLEDIPSARNRIFLGPKGDGTGDARGSADEGSAPIRVLVQGTHMSTQTSTPNLLDFSSVGAQSSTASSPRTDDSSPRTHKRRHSSFVKPSKHEGHRHKHKSPRDRSPRIEEGPGSPLQPMTAESAHSPMKPIRVSSAGQLKQAPQSVPHQPAAEVPDTPASFKAMPGEGGDLAELHRRAALGSPTLEARRPDHRSPRQRALDNKLIRQATGGAPRTKFPEPEPEPVEGELPHYSPRDRHGRGNVLNAGVIKAPGSAYKPAKQRALERQQHRQHDDGSPAHSTEVSPRQDLAPVEDPIPDEIPVEAPAYQEYTDAGAEQQWDRYNYDEAAAAAEAPVGDDSYVVSSAEDMYRADYGYEYGEGDVSAATEQQPEDVPEDLGGYAVASAEDMYGGEQGQYYGGEGEVADETPGYVVPSAENMYGGDQGEGEYYGAEGEIADETEGYVVPSAEDMYSAGYEGDQAAAAADNSGYGDAYDDGGYVVPSAEDLYGADGGYEVQSAEDLYGGGGGYEEYPEGTGGGPEGPVQMNLGDQYEPISSSREYPEPSRYAQRPATGETGNEISNSPGSRSKAGNVETPASGHASTETSPRAQPTSGRRNVLDAAASIVKPSVDHRSPRQRALDNKAARAAGATPSPRAPVVPLEDLPAEVEEDVAPEHVRQRKNVLEASEAIMRPVVGSQRSVRGNLHSKQDDEHVDDTDVTGHSSTEFTPHTPPVVRPASGRPRTGRSRVASADHTDAVGAFEEPPTSRPPSGRPRTGASTRPAVDSYPAVVEEIGARPRTGSRTHAVDALDEAVARSQSKGTLSRPTTGRRAVPSDPVGDVLDEAVAESKASRPPYSRPRTALSAASQTEGDALDNEVSLANLALGSRPASGRPLTARSNKEASQQPAGEAGDILDQAVLATSRPASSGRPFSGRNPYQS